MVDPTTDPEALDGADLGVVDALRGLRQEAELLRGRLASLKAMQGNLADAVFQRVHEDYSQRLADLEARSAPLRAQARLAYAGLRDRLAAIQHAYASIQIDRQEIDLRHQLGEYDDAERTERLAAIDSALRERSIAQDRAESLRARFLEVFESEADLEPAPPPPVSTRSATVLATLVEEPSPDEELAALTLDASMLAQIPEPGTASVVEPPPVPREDTAPAHVEAAVTQILQVLEMPDLPSIPPAPAAPVPAPPPTKAAAAARAASPEPRIAVPRAARCSCAWRAWCRRMPKPAARPFRYRPSRSRSAPTPRATSVSVAPAWKPSTPASKPTARATCWPTSTAGTVRASTPSRSASACCATRT